MIYVYEASANYANGIMLVKANSKKQADNKIKDTYAYHLGIEYLGTINKLIKKVNTENLIDYTSYE
jgi:hypothetical protein